MSRNRFRLVNAKVRANAICAVHAAPEGYDVVISEPRRTLPQNALLHAILTDVVEQARHPITNVPLSLETWKVLLLKEFGHEVAIVPSLDGSEAIAVGQTRHLKESECREFITFVEAKGAELGVRFTADERSRDARY